MEAYISWKVHLVAKRWMLCTRNELRCLNILSIILSYREDSKKGRTGQGKNISHSHMAIPVEVPNSTKNARKECSSPGIFENIITKTPGSVLSPNSAKEIKARSLVDSQQREYQKGLPNLLHMKSKKGLNIITSRPGIRGLAGIINGSLIHFDVL